MEVYTHKMASTKSVQLHARIIFGWPYLSESSAIWVSRTFSSSSKADKQNVRKQLSNVGKSGQSNIFR